MTTDSFNKKSNNRDEHELSEEFLLELKRGMKKLILDFPELDVEPDNPQRILDNLVDSYKNDKSWSSLKKKLSYKYNLDVIDIIRKEILGEVLENPTNPNENIFDWLNFDKTNLNIHGQNDFFMPAITLSQKSLFLCFFLNKKPFLDFKNFSASIQTEMILELLSEVYFMCTLGSVVACVESKNNIDGYCVHSNSSYYFYSKNTFVEGQILFAGIESIKKYYLNEGFEYINEYSRTGLSKDQLFGFCSLLNFGCCIQAAYEHYESQKNIKTKMNKKSYRLQQEALKALAKGNDFCFEALLLLGGERIREMKEQLSDANNKTLSVQETLRARSAKGGIEAARLPDSYEPEMMSCLSEIVAFDKERVLRVNDVANFLCIYMNQSSERELFDFKWKGKYSRSQSWFKAKIKQTEHKYLSSRGAPNKQKIKVLINELKEYFSL
jgi:hypothetical protein